MAELKEEFKDVQVACLCFDGGQQWGSLQSGIVAKELKRD